MKILLSIVLFILTSSLAIAQEIRKCNDKKAYWHFGKDSSSYIIRLEGILGSTQNDRVIVLNGHPLQYVVVYKDKYMQGIEGKDTATFMPLIVYARSEGEYISRQFGNKLELTLDNQSRGKMKILLWYYKMPISVSTEVKHQLIANVIIGDKIIGLSTSQFNDQNFDDVKDFLIKEITTLKEIKDSAELDKLCRK